MQINDISKLNVKNSQDISNKKNLDIPNEDKKMEDVYKREKINEENGYNLLKSNIDEKMIKEIMEETEKAKGLIQNLLRDMLNRQIGNSEDQETSLDELIDIYRNKIDPDGNGNIKIDEIAQKEAKELLGPGGEWSPEKVSERIVDFSIAVFGGDKSKIGIIRDAIDRGFVEAEKDWGSSLPEITNETRTLINEKLENWINANPENMKEE